MKQPVKGVTKDSFDQVTLIDGQADSSISETKPKRAKTTMALSTLFSKRSKKMQKLLFFNRKRC